MPSVHGVGAFGPEAIHWIDRLAAAGQKWWQILPIGPPDKGNSPYTPLSTFACNPLLISPEWLVEDGLLHEDEIVPDNQFPEDIVDFSAASQWKESLLTKAFESYKSNRDGCFNRLSDRFMTSVKPKPLARRFRFVRGTEAEVSIWSLPQLA